MSVHSPLSPVPPPVPSGVTVAIAIIMIVVVVVIIVIVGGALLRLLSRPRADRAGGRPRASIEFGAVL